MSISSLRWRVASALIAAGAAAIAVLGLAVPAGASTGTSEISPEQAGYTATGAQFRNVTATVFLRNPAQYASEVGSYGHSIQLWSPDLVLVLGVSSSTTSTAGFTPAATVYNRSTHAVMAQTPGTTTFPSGDTVTERMHYDLASGAVTFTASDRAGRSFAATQMVAAGESFGQARIGTEFGTDPWTAPSSYTPPANFAKIAVYSSVRLTSYTGHNATLVSWWVNHSLLANTGQQTGSDWVAVPSNLYNGGASFQTAFVPVKAQGPKQPVLH
ncbi:MAG: hypothetical protein LBV34_09145 [Nocardiopsaceae bacterium]|jgi:hypothetical protein|nr:hypothetical protein [Nocardiopsaceae bacterium]